MSSTPVVLDDEQWERLLDYLGTDPGEDLAACRDAIARQLAAMAAIDTDAALGLLQHPVRRGVLRHAGEREEVGVQELARRVAQDVDEDLDTVRLSLYHRHLPKLADAGVLQVEDDAVRFDDDPLLDWLGSPGDE